MKNPIEKDKRMIDDPQLNQDISFDRKDEEDFDNSDDFHKYDDTDENTTPAKQEDHSSENKNALNTDNKPLNTDGQFDGNINI